MKRLISAGMSLGVCVLAFSNMQEVNARPSASYARSAPSRPSIPRSPPVVVRSSSGYGGSSGTHASSLPVSHNDRVRANSISASSLSDYRASRTPSPTPAPSQAYPTRNYQTYTPSTPRPTYIPTPVSRAPTYFPPAPAPAPAQNNNSGLTGFVAGMATEHLLHHDQDHTTVIMPQNQPQSAPVSAPGNTSQSVQPPVSVSEPAPAPTAPAPHGSNGNEPTHSSLGSVLLVLFLLSVLAGAGFVIFRVMRGNSSSETVPSFTPENKPKRVLPVSLGSSITIPALATMDDPTKTVPFPLHFDPEGRGAQTVLGEGVYDGKNNLDLYVCASGELNDFVRLRGNECRFMSWMDTVNPESGDEWNTWLDDSSGLMGLPTFISRDNAEWERCVSPENPNRIPPAQFRVPVTTLDGTTTYRYTEVMYRRKTGYENGYPGIEYLLIRLEEHSESGDKQAEIRLYAGVDIEKTSLGM